MCQIFVTTTICMKDAHGSPIQTEVTTDVISLELDRESANNLVQRLNERGSTCPMCGVEVSQRVIKLW